MSPLCSTCPPALVSPPGLSEWVRGPGSGVRAAATWVTVSVHRCGGRSREEEEPERWGLPESRGSDESRGCPRLGRVPARRAS